MKVSIVTPVYNDPRVGRALDSILGQRLDHELETVVVDAGSRDGTLDVLERYRDRISVLISEPDGGIYDGMNKGVGRATGDVIGILNADDRYCDDAVLRDVTDALESTGADLCYGNIVYVNGDDQRRRVWNSGPPGDLRWRLGWMPPHPAFFVRKHVYERHGAFNTAFRISADYELMLRLMVRHRVGAVHLDRQVVFMAMGGMSNRSVGNVIKANLEVGRAWRCNGLRGGHLAPLLKPARKIPQFLGAGSGKGA